MQTEGVDAAAAAAGTPSHTNKHKHKHPPTHTHQPHPPFTQVHFACVDLELHARYTPGGGETAFDRDRAVAARTQVMPPFPEDRFLCSFSHIFAGGYSAGYYS